MQQHKQTHRREMSKQLIADTFGEGDAEKSLRSSRGSSERSLKLPPHLNVGAKRKVNCILRFQLRKKVQQRKLRGGKTPGSIYAPVYAATKYVCGREHKS